ncbi:hypothetical protein IEZ26_12185 [Nocardioides cavernae]|uniref:DUF4064 domain-containing protein n=1 Tax=Nocardioides cavernae TaxID=1921566 RepID=A0ABR8NCS8_9ACTN|nr:hypothetical protein [Nocardioides cavernae]MBD3925387.1 hypothetical protein [Nocardioides cavernae]MBM7514234.1 uncharacterized membrane protein HdeD (DUF308 family) [Nocardioides cavernae]
MDRPRLRFWLTLGLGLLYVAAGIAESVRAVTSGDGGLWFWFGTLVGGGALVLSGMVASSRHPNVGRTLICVGSMMGVLATGWTLVVPLIAVAVVVLNIQKPTTD